jgi:FdhE protein
MTVTADSPIDPLEQRLSDLVNRFPDLKDIARLYEIILPLLRDTDLAGSPVFINDKQACAKMAEGMPLLNGLELKLDCEVILELMLRLVSALAVVSEKNKINYDRIKLALEDHRLNVASLFSPISADIKKVVTSAADRLDLDPDLLLSLMQSALKPALRAWCRQLTPLVKGVSWPYNFCFICGAKAALGELQENNLVKHLRCGQCGSDWRFKRLACMHCGNDNHQTLGYLYLEPYHEKMRVEICDKCKGYLKVIVSFFPTPPEMLALEELETLYLDFIAQDHGYCFDQAGEGATSFEVVFG